MSFLSMNKTCKKDREIDQAKRKKQLYNKLKILKSKGSS